MNDQELVLTAKAQLEKEGYSIGKKELATLNSLVNHANDKHVDGKLGSLLGMARNNFVRESDKKRIPKVDAKLPEGVKVVGIGKDGLVDMRYQDSKAYKGSEYRVSYNSDGSVKEVWARTNSGTKRGANELMDLLKGFGHKRSDIKVLESKGTERSPLPLFEDFTTSKI